MTSSDAERPEGSSLPEHEQQAWDAIVADLSGQIDLGPGFPADPQPPAPLPLPAAAPAVPASDDEEEELEPFEPPAPPPIPRPADAVARFSWAAVIAGPILVLLATFLDMPRVLANLGVVLTVGGFVALVWRMKDEREDDDDDGAVL